MHRQRDMYSTGQKTLEAPLHNYVEEYNVMEPTLGNKFDNF